MATATPIRRIVGLVAGAALGLQVGGLFVWAWFMLGLPPWTSDPKALDMLLMCCVFGLLVGGWIGVTRLARASVATMAAAGIGILILLVVFQ